MKQIVKTCLCFFFTTITYSQSAYWENLNIPDNKAIFSVAVNNKGYIFAGGNGKIYNSFNNGITWNVTDSTITTGRVDKLLSNKNGLLFGASNNGVLFSGDDGKSWQYLNYNLPNPSVSDIIFDEKENIYAGVYGGGIVRSNSAGSSWTSITGNLLIKDISCMATDKKGTIFVGLYGFGIYKSNVDSGNWISLNNTLRTQNFTTLNITSIIVNNSGYIFAATMEGGIFRSKNSGTSWEQTNTGLIAGWPICLAIDHQGNLYAGTNDHGIYTSTNNGESWTPLNNGLLSLSVYDLLITDDDYMYAATVNGLYRSVNTITNVLNDDKLLTEKYFHSNNYPNPFNPTTTIEYSILELSNVTIEIYNELGQHLITLISRLHQPGHYEIMFDASHYSSGAYFYKIIAGNYATTKKMIFAK